MDSLTVLPLDVCLASFQLIIALQGKSFSFTVHNVPKNKATSLAQSRIQCDSETRSMFQGLEQVLQDRLEQCKSIDSLCLEIKDILDRVLRARPTASSTRAPFYTRVCSEINQIGWEQLAFLGDDFTAIHFRIFDCKSRQHVLRLKLSPEYPNHEPSVSVDFPAAWRLKWSLNAGLRDALSQFEEAVESYQDFWDVMEDVDRKAWVIEPGHPSRSDVCRRIVLGGGHCSILVTVDPSFPRTMPEFRFFGSELSVAPLRSRLKDNSRKWNVEASLMNNLETLLEQSLPRPVASSTEDISADCGICYTYRMPDGGCPGEGSVPDRACDKLSCGRPFHTACLIEWLRSVTTTRQSFNVLFGSCPYCSHPLAVKM